MKSEKPNFAKIPSFIFAILIALFVYNVGMASTPNPPLPYKGIENVYPIYKDSLEDLKTHLKNWFEKEELVGGELLIIKDGKTILHETIGWRNREKDMPFEKNTICRVRSMTRPIVGTAVLMLADEEKVKLDDPVSNYLPEFANERSHEITIRQLLTHSSGLEDTDFPDYIGSIKKFADLKEYVTKVGKLGPVYPPGQQYTYSGPGSATLAYLVTIVSGMPVEEFITKRILEPLEMEYSLCNLEKDHPLRPQISCSYRLKGNGKFGKYWDHSAPQTIDFFRGSGGIYSTTSDYAKFLALWMNGGKAGDKVLLSPEIIREALQSSPQNKQYGLHWRVYDLENRTDGQLPAFGHDGDDGTAAIADPASGLMVLYFTQSRGGTTVQKMLNLIGGIYGIDLREND